MIIDDSSLPICVSSKFLPISELIELFLPVNPRLFRVPLNTPTPISSRPKILVFKVHSVLAGPVLVQSSKPVTRPSLVELLVCHRLALLTLPPSRERSFDSSSSSSPLQSPSRSSSSSSGLYGYARIILVLSAMPH
jgi:hypothetical protein